MPSESSGDSAGEQRASLQPDDVFLIQSMLGGDAAAFNKLMERYDRLVRYTIFGQAKDRCVRDPDWLESVASNTWTGFVRSLRRSGSQRPDSVAAYLTRIARNQTVSALRTLGRQAEVLSLDREESSPQIEAQVEEPSEAASRLEMLEALRSCLSDLDGKDQVMAGQLQAITERRWRDAAEALGTSESTLRSRWRKVLGRLEGCLRRKTGQSFAPPGGKSD
ncbi:MAG: RNA polymerase sigma factor [Phycisphaerales bacterium]|nr:MAG: RNA polymerase sigma factor [Phycisphaerales bacterium]